MVMFTELTFYIKAIRRVYLLCDVLCRGIFPCQNIFNLIEWGCGVPFHCCVLSPLYYRGLPY